MARIFAAGDFHGDKNTAERLAKQALEGNADLIVLNGDIVEEDNPDGILHHFTSTNKPVFLVPGNHDWFATDYLALKYKTTNLHGKHHHLGEVSILGCGGTDVNLTEQEIYDTIIRASKHAKHKKILVTHIHPAGTRMEQFSQFVQGSNALRGAIEKTKPDIVVCGHVHEAEGIEEKIGDTLVINVGKKGRLIEL